MEGNEWLGAPPESAGGFSVVMAQRVLRLASDLRLADQWKQLWIGRPTGRTTAFRPEHRVAAVIAGLACGLRGIAAGSLLLASNGAMRQVLGGRFPDQGTIHRWLETVTPEQAQAWRTHLHGVVREHGQWRQELWSDRMLTVD